MLILLSPAKTLDFETSVSTKNATQPEFTKQSAQLIKLLSKMSAADVAKLMSLSEKLAALNADRFKSWKSKHDAKNAKPAVYAFQGDVYQGLAVDDMSAAEVRRCHKHVRILSGLYGMLRPLDFMQPYRLEMGTKLKTSAGKDLYSFWDTIVRDAISVELRKMKSRLIVNLASNEYSRVAKLKEIDADIISPAFKEWKNGQYKMISFFAKKARGTMTRYLVCNSVTTASGILDFDLDGYKYNAELSTDTQPCFTRKAT